MKKLLLIAVVAAVTLVAGCSNSKKADVDDENVAVKTTGDSISMYLGTLYGAQMVQMADSTLNKTEFIDGMKTALNTASMDSLQKWVWHCRNRRRLPQERKRTNCKAVLAEWAWLRNICFLPLKE